MLLRQTLLYLPAQVLGPLLQLATIFVWSWWLPPAEMGMFTLVMATQDFGFLLVLSWFSNYALRHYSAGSASWRVGYHAAERAVLLLAALLLAALALLFTLARREDAGMGLLLAAIGFMVARGVWMHLSERARADGQILAYSLMQVLAPGGGLLIGLLLVWRHDGAGHALTAQEALAALLASHVLALLAAAPFMRFSPVSWRRAFVVLRQGWRYGLPLIGGGLALWVAMNGVRYLIDWMQGVAAAGLVAIGLGLGQRAMAFAAMFTTAAAFPLAVKAHSEEGERAGVERMVMGGALLMAALVPAALGLLAIATDMTRLLVAEAYRETTLAILPWVVLMAFARNLRSHFPDQIFLLRRDSRMLLALDAVDAALTMAGAFLGLVAHGVVAAMIGAAMGAVLAASVSFLAAMRAPHFRFPWSDAARIVLAAGIMWGVVAWLPPAADLWGLLGKVALGVGLYGLVLALGYGRTALKVLEELRGQAQPAQ